MLYRVAIFFIYIILKNTFCILSEYNYWVHIFFWGGACDFYIYMFDLNKKNGNPLCTEAQCTLHSLPAKVTRNFFTTKLSTTVKLNGQSARDHVRGELRLVETWPIIILKQFGLDLGLNLTLKFSIYWYSSLFTTYNLGHPWLQLVLLQFFSVVRYILFFLRGRENIFILTSWYYSTVFSFNECFHAIILERQSFNFNSRIIEINKNIYSTP